MSLKRCARTSRYQTLCCGTASTIPKRKTLRDPWVHKCPNSSSQIRPSSYIEGYSSNTHNEIESELLALAGRVQKLRQYFDNHTYEDKIIDVPKYAAIQENPVCEVIYKPAKRNYKDIVPHRVMNNSTNYHKELLTSPRKLDNVIISDYLGNEIDNVEVSSEKSLKKTAKDTRKLRSRRHTEYAFSPAIWIAIQKYEQEILDKENFKFEVCGVKSCWKFAPVMLFSD